MEIIVFDKTAGGKKMMKELTGILTKGEIKDKTMVIITKEKERNLSVKFKFAGFGDDEEILEIHQKIKAAFESLEIRDSRVGVEIDIDPDDESITKIVYKAKKDNGQVPVSIAGLKSEMYFLVSTISDAFAEGQLNKKEDTDSEED